MSFLVRVFGYSGLARIPIVQDGRGDSKDSVFVFSQPYLWAQTLTSNGTSSVSSTVAPIPANHTLDPTTFVRVEVPDGQTIRYEMAATGTATAATANSPVFTGRDQLQFGPGWIFSFIDATGT